MRGDCKGTKRKATTAWLVTWVGTTRQLSADNCLVAIISGRRSASFVQTYVEHIYLSYCSTAFDAVDGLNTSIKKLGLHGTEAPPQHIIVGHNPYLFARKVEELKVIQHLEDEIEEISWIELPVFKNAENASGVKVSSSEKHVMISRRTSPILQGYPS